MAIGFVAGVVTLVFGHGIAADQLVLRDLTSRVNVTVADMDADGVLLVGATRLGWDQLKSGIVAPERQADFDRWLRDVGEPLFRIRARLEAGDHRDLVELTAPLATHFEGRESPTAALLRLAEYRGHLSHGRRAAALEAWFALRAFPSATSRDAAELASLPWPVAIDEQHPYPPELAPVWFDVDETAARFPGIAERFSELNEPTITDRLLYASLAIAAGQAPIAQQVLAEMEPASDLHRDWILILQCQQERLAPRAPDSLAQLKQRLPMMSASLAPLAVYEIGLAALRDQPPSATDLGLLELLRIPAEYPNAPSDLIAAALQETENRLRAAGAALEADKIRRERLRLGTPSSMANRTRSRETQSEPPAPSSSPTP